MWRDGAGIESQDVYEVPSPICDPMSRIRSSCCR